MAKKYLLPTLFARTLFVVVAALALLWTGTLSVAAQSAPTPITLNQNVTGTFAVPATPLVYSVAITTPQTININVFGITPGVVPALRVLTPTGLVLQTVANPSNINTVSAPTVPVSVGTYLIEVQSANGQPGDFLLAVQAGVPLPPPELLQAGLSVGSDVSQTVPLRSYTFSGLPNETLRLIVASSSPTSAPVVTLKDAATLEVLASSSARLLGVQYRLPAITVNYVLEVSTSGAGIPEAFILCLEREALPSTCPLPAAAPPVAVVPTLTPAVAVATRTLVPLPATGSCVVASADGSLINVRSGPGTSFPVVTQLAANGTAAVVGRLADNSWYHVNLNGMLGWMAASVVRTGGQCVGVPIVTVTATPVPVGPTATATATSIVTQTTPTSTPTATATTEAAPLPTLNFSLPPNFGSVALTSGFVPDPTTVLITSGGTVDVSYLGGGCTGFTTSAPDFSLNYTSGGFPTLRIYYVGANDSTLVINSPSGSYFCNDDSFGTFNPTVDFNSPSTGRYDIWVGSFSPGGGGSGTLYITENLSNQP
jgi:uncharacterized protein YraI